jgi:hypothetical protein
MLKKFAVASLAVAVTIGASAPFIHQFENKAYASDFTTAESVQFEQYQQEALTYINDLRAKQGLAQLVLDPILNKVAENHAYYLTKNNVNRMSAAYLSGYEIAYRVQELAGNSAGYFANYLISVNLGSTNDMKNNIIKSSFADGSSYTLLTRYADKLGVGKVGDKTVFIVKNAAVNSSTNEIMYPYNGQKDAEVVYQPTGYDSILNNVTGLRQSGTVISYEMPAGDTVKKNTLRGWELKDSKGLNVPFFEDYWRIYPKEKLKYNETYTVKLSYVSDSLTPGQTHTATWSFTTKSEPAPTFDDYAGGKYWSDTMLWAVDKGLITGFDTGFEGRYLLKPYAALSEYQLLMILFRYLEPERLLSLANNTNTFENYSYSLYTLAQEYGLPTMGKVYRPSSSPITRGQMAMILASAHSGRAVSEEEAVQFMYNAGLSNGKSATEKTYESYGVNDILLRGQVASFFMKYDEYINK